MPGFGGHSYEAGVIPATLAGRITIAERASPWLTAGDDRTTLMTTVTSKEGSHA